MRLTLHYLRRHKVRCAFEGETNAVRLNYRDIDRAGLWKRCAVVRLIRSHIQIDENSRCGELDTNSRRKVLRSSPWARHLLLVQPGHMGDTTYLRHR
jgi:hypothetical protein